MAVRLHEPDEKVDFTGAQFRRRRIRASAGVPSIAPRYRKQRNKSGLSARPAPLPNGNPAAVSQRWRGASWLPTPRTSGIAIRALSDGPVPSKRSAPALTGLSGFPIFAARFRNMPNRCRRIIVRPFSYPRPRSRCGETCHSASRRSSPAGRRWISIVGCARRRRGGKNSSCTTARLTRTPTFTSATC